MEKIRFAIVGSGWRSKFFLRIAAAHQDQFEVCSMLVRSEEKKRLFREDFGMVCTTSKEDLLSTRPQFVVIAVGNSDICKVSLEYLDRGIPVLAETPAGISVEELNALWKAQTQKGGKLQIAEQYQFYPRYSEIIRECRTLGDRQNVFISCVHGYHSASLARLLLGLQNEQFTVFGKSYSYPITETDSREGIITDGRVAEKETSILTIEFENGKNVFYNFSGVQYHSLIRTRHLMIQGSRGEIDDLTIRYLDDQQKAVTRKITYQRDPFLPEDETAIRKCLIGMKDYIDRGIEFYPLSAALQDAYISILMDEAVQTGTRVQSRKQSWQEPAL